MPYSKHYKDKRSYSRSRSRSRNKKDHHYRNHRYEHYSKSSRPVEPPKITIDFKRGKSRKSDHHKKRYSSSRSHYRSSSSDSSSSSSYSSRKHHSRREDRRNYRRSRDKSRERKHYSREKKDRYDRKSSHEHRNYYAHHNSKKNYEENSKVAINYSSKTENSRDQREYKPKNISREFPERNVPSPKEMLNHKDHPPKNHDSYQNQTHCEAPKNNQQTKSYTVPVNSGYKEAVMRKQSYEEKEKNFENFLKQEKEDNKKDGNQKNQKMRAQINVIKRSNPNFYSNILKSPEKQKVSSVQQTIREAQENLKIQPLIPNFLILDGFKSMSKYKAQTLESGILETLKASLKFYQSEKERIFSSGNQIGEECNKAWIKVPDNLSEQQIAAKNSLQELQKGIFGLGETFRKIMMLE